MKIALAQTNPIIGDIAANTVQISHYLSLSREESVDLVIFPEMALLGYPPKDLLLKPDLIEQSQKALHDLAAKHTDIAFVIGCVIPADSNTGMPLHNAGAFIKNGRVDNYIIKTHLPTYDVFDERRYFQPARIVHQRSENKIVELNNIKIGITICEDLWLADQGGLGRTLYEFDPALDLVKQGAQVIINCSASPFVLGKDQIRNQIFSDVAKANRVPLLFCNQVGGNDELVFDGKSCVYDKQGQIIAKAKSFEQDLLILDLNETHRAIRDEEDLLADAYHALVLGLKDYCKKCKFKSIVLGLSGGIDSALTAALAVAAIGAENVRGIALPSRYSSQGSLDDAQDLAGRLGIQYDVLPIDAIHQASEKLITPLFENKPLDATEENIQARIRGLLLMAISNKHGCLLVTTGNKSELAVGYCTLYGDMCGGLAVLSDVPKTLVWDLSNWINQSEKSPLKQKYHQAVIPENSISKPPSAELRPDQEDQDSLPPYAVLDEIIFRYVEQHQSAKQIITQTQFAQEVVCRILKLIDLNEYKRKQAAPGIKITARAFGFGRRMPIAQNHMAKG